MDSGLPLYHLQFSDLNDLLPRSVPVRRGVSPLTGIMKVICEETDHGACISSIKSN